MDSTIFDALTRNISGMTRRTALRGLVSTAVALMSGAEALDTEAKRRKKGKKRRQPTPQVPRQDPQQDPQQQDPGQTCSDGLRNGSETDIDCGGGTCPRCAVGKTCTGGKDCASALCAAGTCKACANPTECGTDADGQMCACRDHESGQRFCTRINGRLLPVGTPCSVCTGGEQCFPINGGAGGIECILPCA